MQSPKTPLDLSPVTFYRLRRSSVRSEARYKKLDSKLLTTDRTRPNLLSKTATKIYVIYNNYQRLTCIVYIPDIFGWPGQRTWKHEDSDQSVSGSDHNDDNIMQSGTDNDPSRSCSRCV